MRRTLIVLVLILPTAIALGQQFNGYSRRPRRTNNSGPIYNRPRPVTNVPTTRPVAFVVDPKPDLTGTYRILLTRSIFAANHMVLDQRPGQLGGPEGQLALRGLSLEDGVYSAFIEDTINHSVLRVAAGQAIARGLVAEITLDALHYQREGSKTEVKIGQTLEGFPAPSSEAGAAEGRFGRRGGNRPAGRFGRGANASYGRPGIGNSSSATGRTPNRPAVNSATPLAERNTNRPGNATPGGPNENEGDFNPPPEGPPDLGPGSGPGDGPPDGGPGFAPPDEGPGGPSDGSGFGGPPGGPPPEVVEGPDQDQAVRLEVQTKDRARVSARARSLTNKERRADALKRAAHEVSGLTQCRANPLTSCAALYIALTVYAVKSRSRTPIR